MSLVNDKVNELMEKMRNDGIKFIRFEASSITGKAIGMLVPLRNAEYFTREGFPFVNASLMQTINTGIAIEQFEEAGFRNVSNYPDLDSYRVLSWKNLTPTASLFIAQASKYDNVYPKDPRSIAINQLKILKDKYGMDILSSIEHEFTLLDNKGKPISNPGCYHLERISKFSEFFGKVEDNLHKMDIKVDRMHPELASGQYEITAVPEFNIKAVDNAYW